MRVVVILFTHLTGHDTTVVPTQYACNVFLVTENEINVLFNNCLFLDAQPQLTIFPQEILHVQLISVREHGMKSHLNRVID
jgi:hypothetical protein